MIWHPRQDECEDCAYQWAAAYHDFWCQVAITALLRRETQRRFAFGGVWEPGEGEI